MSEQGTLELPGGSVAGSYRALSLKQPSASLVAIGAKRIETRSWFTSYCGPLAIHAAKGFPVGARYWCTRLPFVEHLHAAFQDRAEGTHLCDALPRGVVVATCELVGCVPITREQRVWNYPDARPGQSEIWIVPPGGDEWHFGDYTPGRYAWLLRNVQRLAVPIPAKGKQGLWTWERPNNRTVLPASGRDE